MGIGSDYLNNPLLTAQANVGSAYGNYNKGMAFGELTARKPVEYKPAQTAIETQTPQFGILPEDKYHQAMKAIEINEALAQAREESERDMYIQKPAYNDGELTPAIGGITWA